MKGFRVSGFGFQVGNRTKSRRREAKIACALLFATIALTACETEAIRKNEEIIRQQEAEIRQLREQYQKQRTEWMKKREAEVKE